MKSLKSYAEKTAQCARDASRIVAALNPSQKKKVLLEVVCLIGREKDKIARANQKDLEAASRAGLSTAMIDRLRLTPKRIDEMREGVLVVSDLPDPIGKVLAKWKRPNG